MMSVASLALATLFFVGTHLLMSHPLRLRLVREIGESGFRIAYSLVALLTFGGMILAYAGASSVPLWIAPDWWWIVASLLMLLASILLVGSFIRNPASVHPGAKKFASPEAEGVFAITRHPMNWSFIMWSLVHLSVWGSPRNIIVAMGILVLAVAGSIGQDKKKASTQGEWWRRWMMRTSFIPFGALLRGKARWSSATPSWQVLAAGFAFWLLVTSIHAPSASPLAWIGLI